MNALLILFIAILSMESFALSATSEEFIRQNAVPFQAGDPPDQFIRELAGKRLLLLGELHGTKEMPALAARFLVRLAKDQRVAFGIEFPVAIAAAASSCALSV